MRCGWIPGRERSSRGLAEEGFTLVEVLVALAIVGMLAVGAIEAFGAGLRAQGVANRHIEALSLADARLSALAALPADSLRRHPSTEQGRFAPPLESYRWRTSLQRVSGTGMLWRATAEVSWEDGQESLETVLFRPVASIDEPPQLSF